MDAVKSLRNWNLAAAAAHAALLTGLAIAFRDRNKEQRTVTMYRGSIPQDAATNPEYTYDACNNVDFPLQPKATAKHDPLNWLYAFFGITIAAHLFYAANPGGVYSNAVLGKGWNPFRWVEYGASAGIMAYIISMLDGEKNQNAATLIAFSTLVINLQGIVVEHSLKQNARSEYYASSGVGLGNKAPHVDGVPVLVATLSGWILLAVSWYAILSSFFSVLSDAKKTDAPEGGAKVEIPKFLYGIGFSQLLFFITFGNVQLRQIMEWRREQRALALGAPVTVKPYIAYEKQYIWLSFASKATLAGFLGYGLLRRGGVSCP